MGRLDWIPEYGEWVPLHEAASRGNLDCVKILLLDYQVAHRPRTFDDKLPLDLAKESNQEETIVFLGRIPFPSFSVSPTKPPFTHSLIPSLYLSSCFQ